MRIKTCSKCGEVKSVDEFYKHKTTKDGLHPQCKDCHKARVRKYNKTNKEQIRAYNRQRYKTNKEYIKVQRRAYSKTNPNKRKAHKTLNNAIESGNLTRPTTCEHCGCNCKPDAHHWSYKEEHWLDIIWLCRSCHQLEHIRLNELEESEAQKAA